MQVPSCGPSCVCRDDTISLTDNNPYDIPSVELGTWGANNWWIALEFLIPANANYLPDGYAAFYIRSDQPGSPYTGPSAFLYSDRLDIRMDSGNTFSCTAGFPLPDSFFGKFQSFFVSFVGGVFTVEFAYNRCVSDVLPTNYDPSLFASAPLRFGGNHVDTNFQNMEATIRHVQVCRN